MTADAPAGAGSAPGTPPPPTGTAAPAALVETHSAVVVFLGDRAYKVKKPVDLGFLDFRRRVDREAACHREVALNRRLAPDVYLGVADVVGEDGQPCDHLVVMRRLPADRRLTALVRAGEDVDVQLWRLAHQLAAFHAAAERSPAADAAAGRDALAARWAANTAEMLELAGSCLDPGAVGDVDRRAHRYLEGREPLFAARIAQGRACDGHGDLLADDVFCLDDAPRVLDCLDFDVRLRLDDALADVAFLAMDLERLGRPDLGERFLTLYREHAGDSWPASLAHHHVAYRAQVRAKVAAIRAAQGGAGARAEARGLLAMSRAHLAAGTVRLVVVGGLPGTGKTTVARAVADRLGAVCLHSDEIRKQQAGLRPDVPVPAGVGEGLYRPDVTAAVYAEMLRRAAVALGLGESVVLDASFTSAGRRAAARALAGTAAADLVELRCEAPAPVAAERIRQRLARRAAARSGTTASAGEGAVDASDATPEVAAALAAAADPWPEAATVLTTGAPDEVVEKAVGQVLTGPGGSPGPAEEGGGRGG